VKVVEPETDRSVVVRINDRGPYVRGRVLDLSRGAARALGVDGVAPVTIQELGDGREAEE
jgi:rare lipoprotein A